MFTVQFWKNAAEATITGAAAGGLAAIGASTTPLSLHELAAIGAGAAVGAIVSFLKQLGGVQASKSIPKVAATAEHAK